MIPDIGWGMIFRFSYIYPPYFEDTKARVRFVVRWREGD